MSNKFSGASAAAGGTTLCGHRLRQPFEDVHKNLIVGFPGHPAVKTSPPLQGEQVRSLPRERRSHMPGGQKTKDHKTEVVTNSLKT